MIQHQFSEIKRIKSKVYNPVAKLHNLNRALAEIAAFDGDDEYMYNYLVNRYLQSLDLYHINGRAGSLLPKIKERKIIDLANAIYEDYAKLTPTGYIADANQEAVAAVRQAGVAALWAVAR